jgi:hypothetical protein
MRGLKTEIENKTLRKDLYEYICTQDKVTTIDLRAWFKQHKKVDITKEKLNTHLTYFRNAKLITITGHYKINGAQANYYTSTQKDFNTQVYELENPKPIFEPEHLGAVASKWLGFGVATKQTVKPMFKDTGEFTERYGRNGVYYIEHRPARLESGDNRRKIENRGIGSSFAMIDAL